MTPAGDGADPVPGAGVEDATARVEDVADYIAELAAQLALLARSRNLDLIAYLLEMARMEAANTARRPSQLC